jgi:hypothetical protein
VTPSGRQPDGAGTGAGGRLAGAALLRIIWGVAFGVAFLYSAVHIGGYYFVPDAGNLFIDTHIYFRATEAWIAGGNPWTIDYRGVPFAGIPPTLLINVPLLPLGEGVAIGVWIVANTTSIVYLIRRLQLPLWILVMLPVFEGWLAGSPDLTLAALAVGGGAWIAALVKPYSIPAILADRRWRPLALAAVIGIATLPVLPWLDFWESRSAIAEAFAIHAGRPPSAAGSPPLLALVALGLLSLGWRRGWSLATPGLLAQQPHYLVFSLDTITRSRILTLAAMMPLTHAMAVGIFVYAVVERFRARG